MTSDWDKCRYFNFVLSRQAGSFPYSDTQKVGAGIWSISGVLGSGDGYSAYTRLVHLSLVTV